MPDPIPWGVRTSIYFVTGNAVFYSTNSVLPKCLSDFPGIWMFVFNFFPQVVRFKLFVGFRSVYSCSKHLMVLSQVKPKGLYQEDNYSLSLANLMARHLCPAF